MGKSKTKNQKKARITANQLSGETYGSVPHSFVFHRGQIGKSVEQLMMDMRRVMEPYTAQALKVRKKNVLKDFVTAAGPLGVTHFLIFTKTETSVNLRLARLPKGPTVHFQVTKYTLIKDVISSLKRHRMHEQQFSHHPLLVLNNFGLEGMHIKLMATMLQNMFPSINVYKVNLNDIKRCVLVNYDPASQEIEFRHYSLKVVPVGMSKGVKKLLQEKFPNMSKLEDISELLLKGVNLSESEAEQDGEHNVTELPQVYSGRGNMRSQQSAVRLTEIGPRMTLRLVKIVEGMGEGNILYHSIVTKSEKEIQEILKRKEARLKEKAVRRSKQEQNIAQKKEKRDENKKKSLEGMKRKRRQEGAESDDSEVEDPGTQGDQPEAEESEDEAEYYRQAVGEEPDEDMFPTAKRKHRPGKTPMPFKKRKLSKVAGEEKSRSRPMGKASFGAKNFAGRKFGGKNTGVLVKLKVRMNSSSNCTNTFSKELLPPIYGVEMCVALMGNILALWLLVTKERRNWHTGVVFSCNLVISDIFYALTLPLLIHDHARDRKWAFSAAVCKLERFLFTCNFYASIYFIMCISVNRYLAIVHPFFTRTHIRPKHAKITSLLVWIVVAGLASPILYYSGLKNNNGKTRCSLFTGKHKTKRFSYMLFTAILGCFIPFLATFASYFGVLWVVCKNANITILEKKKVALIVGVVCVLYTVSFVPYNILQILNFPP
ncbi:suppressor of SWI4 1, partial [Clarias magur]